MKIILLCTIVIWHDGVPGLAAIPPVPINSGDHHVPALLDPFRRTVRRRRPPPHQNVPGVYPDTLQLPHQPLAVTEKQLNERPANLHQLVACAGGGEVVGSAGIIVNEGMRVRHSAELFLVVRDDWQGKGAGGR
ncbi:putative acetyltransferase YhhY [Chromobacterium violaceum]|uniref:Putative acetyltransferase YhhY n=1 Tax=Chromobacterium violaceum TaxID=536 RepID=A0A3S4IJ51_CHRVL|nr:putative acetyltransferase YhhY [Chromobacterium violaceum]